MNPMYLNESNFNSFINIMDNVKATINHAFKAYSTEEDIMNYIEKTVKSMDTVNFITKDISNTEIHFGATTFDFSIVNEIKSKGCVSIHPIMNLVIEKPKSGVIRFESEDFILFKIDCNVARDCWWSELFKNDLKGITALNIDNFKYELGSSCWWDGATHKYSYVLIHKMAIKDMEKYIEDDVEEYFNHKGKVEYLLYKDFAKVGFIWNDSNAQISSEGDIVFENQCFRMGTWGIVDDNYKIAD